MAEIVISHVLGRSEPSGRQFFCHGCKKKFTHRLPDPSSSMGSQSCPTCGSEFVEEIEQEEQRTVGGDSLGSTGATAMETDPEVERISIHPGGFRRRTTTANQTADTNDATAQFMSQTRRLGGLREQSEIPVNEFVIGITPPPRPFGAIIHEHIQRLIDDHEGRRPNDTGSTNPPPPQGNHFQPPSNPQPHSHPRPFPPQPPTDPGRSATDFHLSVGLPWFLMTQAQERERERERMRRYQRLHRVNPAPPPQMPRFGGPPQIFIGGIPVNVGLHGTPGDYAWGPQGLDNIITQLLATFEDNGPPPADTKKVEELPFVQATEEDLKPCADCSVCKEPFTVGENLRQLPCTHLYHNDCILPWLKLHDTCPTCRFSINTGKPADD